MSVQITILLTLTVQKYIYSLCSFPNTLSLPIHIPFRQARTHSHTHTRIHTHARTHSLTCILTHMHVHTHTHAYTHTRARTHSHTHARTRTHTVWKTYLLITDFIDTYYTSVHLTSTNPRNNADKQSEWHRQQCSTNHNLHLGVPVCLFFFSSRLSFLYSFVFLFLLLLVFVWFLQLWMKCSSSYFSARTIASCWEKQTNPEQWRVRRRFNRFTIVNTFTHMPSIYKSKKLVTTKRETEVEKSTSIKQYTTYDYKITGNTCSCSYSI